MKHPIALSIHKKSTSNDALYIKNKRNGKQTSRWRSKTL